MRISPEKAGKILRAIRNRKGLTQNQVEEKAHKNGQALSRSVISNYENGAFNARVNQLLTLCEIYFGTEKAIDGMAWILKNAEDDGND